MLVVVILAGLGLFLSRGRVGESGIPDSSMATSSASTSTAASTTSSKTTSKSGVTGTGNFTVSPEPTVDVPDFRAPVKFTADTSDDARTAVTKNVAIVQAALSKNALDLKSVDRSGYALQNRR